MEIANLDDTVLLLQETKDYLRVDYDDDDTLIQHIIDTAQIYIEAMAGINYKGHDDGLKLAKHLHFKIVSDMYSNRSAMMKTEMKEDIVATSILDKLSNYEEVI